jgi:hypothetical protein
MRDRAYAMTTRLVAENGLYLPPSSTGGPPPPVLVANGIIFRPGGVAGGNVYTTWPTVMAALTAVNGAVTVYVDSSIAPAVVPPGIYNGFGCAVLSPYNDTLLVTPPSNPIDILTIADGATLSRWSSIRGLLTVECTCTTTAAFSFDYGPMAPGNKIDLFYMTLGAMIVMKAGAAVAAIQVPPIGFFSLIAELAATLDATATPGVPVIMLNPMAGVIFEFFNEVALNGEWISGGPGTNIKFSRDDTINPFTSALFMGTLNDDKVSIVTNESSGGAGAGMVATADGAGGVIWSPVTATPLTNVIFRPGGVAGGNVYTTWATAFAAAMTSNDALIMYVDSSLGTPTVPAGTYDGNGALTLATYNSNGEDFLSVADGGVLENIRTVDGLVIEGACVTTSAMTFTPEFSYLTLTNFAILRLLAGAAVPMVAYGAGQEPTLYSVTGELDNSNAPTIPVVSLTATTILAVYATLNQGPSDFPFLVTGNEIGGPAGAVLNYGRDDTVFPFTGTLFHGTLNDGKAAFVTNASSGSAAAGTIATATGVDGGIIWAPPAPSSATIDGVIFRPGGVAAGNVYTTWATAFAAVDATNGTTILYVDSSLATATVPAGTWNADFALTLKGYSPGDTIDSLFMADGAVIENLYKISGLTVMPAAVTTVPFTFADDAILFLEELSSIVFQAGALVPAMQAPAGSFLNITSSGNSGFDNSAAPTVPIVFVPATATAEILNESPNWPGLGFLATGTELGSAVGGTVDYFHDDTVPPALLTHLAGTTVDLPADPHIGSDGTPAAPSYSYSAQRGTGTYRDATSGNLRFAVAGNYVSGFDAFGTLYGFQNAASGPVGVPYILGEGPGSDSTWMFVGTNIASPLSSALSNLTTLRASSSQTWLNCPVSGLGFALHLSVDGADFIQCGGAAGTPDQVCLGVQGSTNVGFFTSLYSTDFGTGKQIIGILNATANVNTQSSIDKSVGYVWTDTRTDGEPQGLVFCATGGAGGLGNGARSAVAPCGLGSHNTQQGDEMCERAYGRTGPIVIGGGNSVTMTIPLENGSLRAKVSILGRLVTVGTSGTVGDTYYSTWDLRCRTIAGVVTVDFFALDAAGDNGSQASMIGATFTATGVGAAVEITIDASAIGAGSGSVEDWQTDLYKGFIN